MHPMCRLRCVASIGVATLSASPVELSSVKTSSLLGSIVETCEKIVIS